MANGYVRSTDGANADDGLTWANADLDLAGATAADAAGDTTYVSQVHAESTTGAIVIASAGTLTNPNKILCASDATGEPPTTSATTGTVTSTSNITITGCVYIKGLTFNVGSGSSATASFLAAGSTTNNQFYENVDVKLLTTGFSAVQFGDDVRSDSVRVGVKNFRVRFGSTAHRVKLECSFKWDGGAVITGGFTPTSIFNFGARGMGDMQISNVDFSVLGAAVHIFERASGNAFLVKIRNCTLPTSWTGSLWNAAPQYPGHRAEMANCYSGSFKYRVWLWDYMGQARDNTVVVRTGGASDDAVPFSVKLTTTADAKYPLFGFDGGDIIYFADTTSAVTLKVFIVHDSQGAGSGGALRTDEIGVKVNFPGGYTDTFKVDPIATGTDYTTSSETWTTTGLTTPVKQEISVTFTPTSKGVVRLTPVLFGASKTVYYCPKVGT